MSRPKILVVEDDKKYRAFMVEEVLQPMGWDVVEAGSLLAAETRLREALIHLAVVDVNLVPDDDGDESGLDLCHRMDPTLPRIVVTGAEDWRVVRRALAPLPNRPRAADGFFRKNEAKELIRQEILRVLRREYEIVPSQRIAVLTSGGDSPGMNSAIMAIVRSAMAQGVEVMGVKNGYLGLVRDEIYKLRWNEVSNIMNRGGTILGTARFPDFPKQENQDKAIENLTRKHIGALIVIGGDGSMKGAKLLSEGMFNRGLTLQTMALPGTIDNDLYGTDVSLGASSAANAMIVELRNMVEPAMALRRIFVVQVMGRYAGFLALEAALGVGADAVLIPEEIVEFDPAKAGRSIKEQVDFGRTLATLTVRVREIAATLKAAFAAGKRYGFIVVAEGLYELTQHDCIGTVQRVLESEIAGWPPEHRPDVRPQILGYPVRGAAPNWDDVWLGAQLGEAAVGAILESRTGKMMGWVDGKLDETDFEKVVRMSNRLPKEIWQDRPSWRSRFHLQKALNEPPLPLF